MRKRTPLLLLGASLFVWLVIFTCSTGLRSADLDSAGGISTNQDSELPATNSHGATTERDVVQQAIEQLRRETEPSVPPAAEAASITNAAATADRVETIEERLGMVERALRLQHQTELEAVHSANRTVLIVAGLLAGAVLIGIFFAVLVFTRAINRISAVSGRLSLGGGWAHGSALPALAEGGLRSSTLGEAEPVNALFTDTIERLERRIRQMEQTSAQPALTALEAQPGTGQPADGSAIAPAAPVHSAREGGGGRAGEQVDSDGRAGGSTFATEGIAPHVSLLIGKGQTLLNLGRAEEALRCFDEAASLDPTNAETLVKRGMALEKLQKMEEALSSYNRAIAADNSMTLAYLYKGAVCNRLQRFREALECYEKALKNEPRTVAS